MGTAKLWSALRQAQQEQRGKDGWHAYEVFSMKRCGVSAKSHHVIDYNGKCCRIPSEYLRRFSGAVVRSLQHFARGALLAHIFEREQGTRKRVQ